MLLLPHILKIGRMLDKINYITDLQFFFEGKAWRNFIIFVSKARSRERGRLGGPINKHYAHEVVLGRGISFDFHIKQEEFLKGFGEEESQGKNWVLESVEDESPHSEQISVALNFDNTNDNVSKPLNVDIPYELQIGSPMPQAYKRKPEGSSARAFFS